MMTGNISLSRKENYYHFFYLLLLMLAAVCIITFVLLHRKTTPFKDSLVYEMQLLEQQKNFRQKQKDVLPYMEKTFVRIDEMPLTHVQSFLEDDIKISIANLVSASNDGHVNDARKDGFSQAGKFYSMYAEDRKIAGKKMENIALFEDEFTKCNIDFKENEQQLAQKKAAMAARSN
jgi:hypothetical protein